MSQQRVPDGYLFIPLAAAIEQSLLAALTATWRKAYDESEHPRDEHGRWTDAGGGDLAEGEKLLLVSERPSEEKLIKWQKQIDDRQKEIADQKQSGSNEDDQLYKMGAALRDYIGARTVDLDSDRTGLNAVYDGDQKLLAIVLTTYRPETKVAELEVGAINDDAKLKALQQVQKKYVTKAERIEANEYEDNKESIKLFEQAGFKASNIGGGIVHLVIGTEQTEGEFARLKVLAEKHAAEILGAGKATAKLAGYDPNLVETSNEVYNFKVGDKSGYTAAGLAHLDTGKITLYPNQIANANNAVSVTVHEVAHHKYETVLKAVAADRKLARADPGPPPDPNGQYWWQKEGGQAAVFTPDDHLRPPYDKKYPLVARFEKHVDKLDERIKADGVTPYSISYWDVVEKYKAVNQFDIKSASHETIAEMARLEVDKGRTGAKPVWRSYYKDVMKTYDDLKAAKK